MSLAKEQIFGLIGIAGIVSFIVYVYLQDVKNEQQSEENQRKFDEHTMAMREKYKDINSYDDFNEGVKYTQYPQLYGYDLRVFKDKKPNLLQQITMDDLKFIYNASKLGIGSMNPDDNQKLLNLLHKIFS